MKLLEMLAFGGLKNPKSFVPETLFDRSPLKFVDGLSDPFGTMFEFI